MKHSTIIDLLRWRVQSQAAQRAYTFLLDGEEEGALLSYAELEFQARKVGGLLQRHVPKGSRVLLLYPSGLDFVTAFFGSLYAGMVPIPTPQPRLNKTMDRLLAIATDAGAAVVLTTSSILSMTEKLFALVPEMEAMLWLGTDALADNLADEFEAPALTGETLAFLQYTSGSTSLPKGVMITHDNLMCNSAELDQTLCHTEETVFVTWLPHFHDMGLVYGLVQPLYRGFPAYVLPPVHFLQRPTRWLEAMTRYRGTHSAAPNFAYELCVRKVTPEQRERLDLSSWRMAANAAEPVSAQVIERFAETFAPCGFRRRAFSPCYGLAEVTLIATGVHRDEETPFCSVEAAALEQHRVAEVAEAEPGARTLVSCGRTAQSAQVLIVNPQTLTPSQPEEVGEIWVSGQSVARGYWGNPDETEQTFHARLADTGEGPFLRTGDLGFIKDGELYVTGRLKDLIIIGGHNYYPQDIEQTVEQCHPALRAHCAAAFSLEAESQELLVLVVEVEPHYRLAANCSEAAPNITKKRPILDPLEVIKTIRRAVAEAHELPLHAVQLLKAGSIPKTTSGKIQRRECKKLFLNQGLEKWGD